MAAPAGGGEPPPQTNPSSLGRSFAAVTKGRPEPLLTAVQLAPRHYGTKDGKPSVSFTQSELQPGVQRLQHSLIAKFTAGRPRIDDVRRLLSQTWDLDTPVTIGAMDARHVLIILHSAPMANRILAHPTRKIGNYLFRLFRWSQDFKRNKEPSTTTAWIRLPGLPAELFNAGYIAAIVGPIGRFLAIDEGTRSCRNPSFARACIELDLHTPLPAEIWIETGTSGGFWQPIEFENKLSYCSHCKLHGHQVETCRKKLAPAENETRQLGRKAEEPESSAARGDLPPDNPAVPYTRSDLTQPQPTVNRHTELPLMDHAPRTSENVKQDWTLVQKKKKHKAALKQGKKDVPKLNTMPAMQLDQRIKGGSGIDLQPMPNDSQKHFSSLELEVEPTSILQSMANASCSSSGHEVDYVPAEKNKLEESELQNTKDPPLEKTTPGVLNVQAISSAPTPRKPPTSDIVQNNASLEKMEMIKKDYFKKDKSTIQMPCSPSSRNLPRNITSSPTIPMASRSKDLGKNYYRQLGRGSDPCFD